MRLSTVWKAQQLPRLRSRAHALRSCASSTEPPAELPALRDGETLELSLKGVSFGGCQEALASVVAGQPVLLVREPENEIDNNAVRVCTLRGTALGYLPKDAAPHFLFDSGCATVAETGRNAVGLRWAVVHAQPNRPGLMADLHPRHVPACSRCAPRSQRRPCNPRRA